ncbi:MAG: hypothetical protein U0132_16215 [Gemmatimonadaceae bacterium]
MSLPLAADRRSPDVISVAVIGNDTVLAALPAHPVQLAHGCHLLGYHTVVPASWGDELIAEAVLRSAEARGRRPAIVCACERARARLTTGAGELSPFMISTIAPPVATARYVRQILPGKHLDITFVGDCASGADPVFDARYSPEVFLVRLRSAGIELSELPTHFENLVPPDRRRFASLPGGCPSADALQRRCPERQLVELTDANLAVELADQLVGQQPVLLDIAAGVGCSCAGVRRAGSPRTARVAVTSLEPPRSRSPVLEGDGIVESITSVGTTFGTGLLARDPNADAPPTAEETARVEAALSPNFGLELFAPEEEAALVLTAPVTATEFASDAPPEISASATASRPRRPLAITPPRALRAVQDRPGYVVPRTGRGTRPLFVRPTPSGVSEPPADEPATPVNEPVEEVPALVGAGDSDPPSVSKAAVPEQSPRFPQAPPPLPRFLGEIPAHITQRAAAQAQLVSTARVVPPPAPSHRGLRKAIFWTLVVLAVFTLAVLSASRGH